MSGTTTEAAMAAVRAAEPQTLSRDEVEQLLGDVRRVRSWLDTVEMSAIRRVRELEAAGQSENAESLLSKASRRSGREAKAACDRTDVCHAAPCLEDSLADGDLTTAHLDAINHAARGLPDDIRHDFLSHVDDLTVRAQQISVESFARECRQLAQHLLAASRRRGTDADELDAQRAASKLSRWVDKVTGMHHTHLELDPLRDAQLAATFNTELARLRAADGNSGTAWQQLQVDAFVNSIAGIRTLSPTDIDQESGTATRSCSDPESPVGTCRCSGSRVVGRRVDRVPQVTLLVSYDWLSGNVHDGICETENGVPLPISTARRLCCDAEIIPTMLGTAGEVLDQGRSVRTATEAQRRALRTMHRGCAAPGCEVGFDACRIHHVRWWGRDHGPTDMANLLPVCERHHHMVHEGGWGLTLEPDRTATWTRPDGQLHHRGPTIDRVRRPSLTSTRSTPPRLMRAGPP